MLNQFRHFLQIWLVYLFFLTMFPPNTISYSVYDIIQIISCTCYHHGVLWMNYIYVSSWQLLDCSLSFAVTLAEHFSTFGEIEAVKVLWQLNFTKKNNIYLSDVSIHMKSTKHVTKSDGKIIYSRLPFWGMQVAHNF